MAAVRLRIATVAIIIALDSSKRDRNGNRGMDFEPIFAFVISFYFRLWIEKFNSGNRVAKF